MKLLLFLAVVNILHHQGCGFLSNFRRRIPWGRLPGGPIPRVPLPSRFPPIHPFTIGPIKTFKPNKPFPRRPAKRYDHNVIVPNVFRLGATEKVVLNLYNYTTATVSAYLTDLPSRQGVFSRISASIYNSVTSKQPIELNFKVASDDIRVFRRNQRVELVIQITRSGKDFREKIPVFVSKQSGYLFIQTNRPIYRPNERVEIRVVPLEQDMSPERENLIEIIVKTPDGIGAAKSVQTLPPIGFSGTTFSVAENPMFGTWSVEAKYSNQGYNTTSRIEFVIRRYVLPTFNVQINMTKNFFLPHDTSVSGYIRANYSYGEPVEGNYFLTLKLKKSPTSEPVVFYKQPGRGSYLETALFNNGEYFFDIPLDEIRKVLQNGETMATLAENSASIFVEATVNARADGVMESDISPDLPILKSPYVIDTSKTVLYYTPGLSYNVEITVKDITTGKPVPGITLSISVDNGASRQSRSNSKGEVYATYDSAANRRNTINVVITTVLPNTAAADQSRTSISIVPYTSPSNSYLHISTPHEPASVDQSNYFITFSYAPRAPSQISYVILSRGTIIKSGSNTPNRNSDQSTEQIPIVQKMVPSARMVAYYTVGAEVVSASVWIEVVDQCKEELTINIPSQILPGENIPFDIRGAPNAVVGISGVDKAAYFLHQQGRLTRESMFRSMEDYDRGCSRGGGSNAANVFLEAGLKIHGLPSSKSQSSACGQTSKKRKKRNIQISQTALEKKLKQCSLDGARDNLANLDCETRGRRCRENFEDIYPGCWRRFRTACYKAARERRIKQIRGISGTGSEADAEASVERRRSAFQDEEEPLTITVVEEGQGTITTVPQAGLQRPVVRPQPSRPRPPPVRPTPSRPRPAAAGPRVPISGGGGGGGGIFGVQSHGNRGIFPLGKPSRPITTPPTTTTTTTTTPAIGIQRSDFNEGLSWPAFQINANGRHRFSRRSRDSITTFIFDAVGMHDSPDGFCVAPPAELRIFKDVFVQLNTPYSLKKQEQAELRIVVFNYNRDQPQEVVLRVRTDPVYCTRFRSGAWSEVVRMRVEAGGSGSASLSVFPLRIPLLKTGRIDVEIRNLRNTLLDSVRKDVLIEPEGEIKDIYHSYPLDLKSARQDSFQVTFHFPEQFVPGTRQCWLYAYSNFLGPSIEVDPTTKEPRGIKDIFRRPYGCGEQNMLVTGPNVYALMYLVSVRKIIPGDLQYKQSVQRIQDGFNQQLKYRSEVVNRLAWSVFVHYPPSTWLNAYVDRVFLKGRMFYTDMDPKPICNSLEWLLGEQEAEGNFRELRPPIHREMHGAVGGRLSLTAYVLITLADARGICTQQLTQRIRAAQNRAVAFLQNNKNDVTFQRPYGLALLTYALTLHDVTSVFALEMNNRLLGLKETTDNGAQVFWRGHPANGVAGTDVHPYWYNRRPQAIDVEATAYALLAQVAIAKSKPRLAQSDVSLTRKIVRWLISQRNEAGAFKSTQDTVVGLQALATYQIWINQAEPQPRVTSMNITLETAGSTAWSGTNQYRFNLNRAHEGVRKEIPVPKDVLVGGNVTVRAAGTGEGVLSYRCIYRTVEDEDGCHFNIQHSIAVVTPDSVGGPPMTIKLTLTFSKPVGLQAEQSIIEISLLTGFAPIESTLIDLAVADVVDGAVERYEVTSQSVILYVNRIDSTPVTLAFLMEQKIKVDNYQPAKINIYDYYEPSVKCGTFYAFPGQVAHIRTAQCDKQNDEVCKCAEGVCPVCRPRDDQLSNTTCLGSIREPCHICDNDQYCLNMFVKACTSNYAYVINITHSPDIAPTTVFATFRARIMEVLKIGNDYVNVNEERTFMMRTDCYGLCRDQRLTTKFLREGYPIMVIGTAPLENLDRDNNLVFKYLLSEGSWMERVIPPGKCRRQRRRYVNLNCGTPNPRSTKCEIIRKFHNACINHRRLKRFLRRGCD